MPKNSSSCSVCNHQDLDSIERRLREGARLEAISEEFPPLTKSSLHRHRANHLAPHDDETSPPKARTLGSTIEETERVLASLVPTLTHAIKKNRLSSASQIANSILRSLEVLARLRGELNKEQPQAHLSAETQRYLDVTIVRWLTTQQITSIARGEPFPTLNPQQLDQLLSFAEKMGMDGELLDRAKRAVHPYLCPDEASPGNAPEISANGHLSTATSRP